MGRHGRALIGLPIVTALLVASVSVSVPVAAQPAAPKAAARAVPPPLVVTITATAFTPAAPVIAVGQTVVFANHSGTAQTVTSSTGIFDSGAIPAGGGYALALPTAGTYGVASTITPALTATLHVGLLTAPGADGDLASADQPDLPPPVADPSELSIDPTLGLTASRTRVLVTFEPTATVADVNRLLAATNSLVLGTVPAAHLWILSIGDSPDFTAVDAAVATLRADAAVSAAAVDPAISNASIPTPPSGLSGGPAPFTWVNNPGPSPANGAWGLEVARFPNAWNLLDAIRRKHANVLTAAVDTSFSPDHPDLTGTLVHAFCQPEAELRGCTPETPGYTAADHGNPVLGLIGGAATGGDPAARMMAVPLDGTTTHGADDIHNVLFDGDLWTVAALINADTPGGAADGLRVINHSQGLEFTNRGLDWAKKYTAQFCGPGVNDDKTAAATLPCTPNNEDGYLSQMAGWGAMARPVLEAGGARNILFVQSAGNDSNAVTGNDGFCVPFGSAGCAYEPIDAQYSSPYNWASRHWVNGATPVITVEALKQSTGRDSYSDIHGDVSAPGSSVFSTNQSTGYTSFNGTSAAAPLVAGLASLITQYDPALDVTQVRAAIMDRTVGVTVPSGEPATAPRIDALNSMLSLPGAALDMADANDPSADGNQRVVLPAPGGAPSDDSRLGDTVTVTNADGTTTSIAQHTASDGVIDLRDFRRYRDAWLQACASGLAGSCSLSPAGIVLDGATTNPKRDLNLDGCVNPADATCAPAENVFARMDLVGAGSLDQAATGTVPLDASGNVVAPAAAQKLTNLQLLQALWGQKSATASPTATPDLGGYTAAQLPQLMVSGDVHVVTDALFAAGATSATVTVSSNQGGNWVDQPPQTVTPSQRDGQLVVTVPVTAAGTEVRASADASIDGDTVHTSLGTGTLHPGEDLRLDLCAAHVQLSVVPGRLTANSTGNLTAKLIGCPGDALSGLPVSFTATPLNAGDHSNASIGTADPATNASGIATATLNAGTTPGTALVLAKVTLADGKIVTGVVDAPVDPGFRVVYRWQETITTYNRSGIVTDLVHNPNTSYTFSDGPSNPAQLPLPITETRDGTISLAPTGATLDERVGAGRYGLTGSRSDTGPFDHYLEIAAADRTKTGVALPQVSMVRSDTDVVLSGLRQIADIGYPYQEYRWSDGSATGAVGGSDFDNFLELGPRTPYRLVNGVFTQLPGDGTAFQVGSTVDSTIRLQRGAGGAWQPYTYCGSTNPTFHSFTDSSLDWNVTGGGHVDIAFTAVVAEAGQNPIPVLPDCTSGTPPTADFTDVPGKAGTLTHFTDTSVAQAGVTAWHWDFGDGTPTSDSPAPLHLYTEAGHYAATLTITDGKGQTATVTHDVQVDPEPPVAGLDDLTVTAGTAVTMHGRLYSGSGLAQLALTVTLTSGATGFPTIAPLTAKAGVVDLPIGTVPVGVYPVTMTVTDPFGQSTTAHATLVVQAGPVTAPPARPPVDTDPAPSCTYGVKVDAETDDLLIQLGAYRIQNGLPPVYPSATLTTAAARHAADMAAKGFFSDTGSDGSTPTSRATDASYDGTKVTEILLKGGLSHAADALLSWQLGAANTALIDPQWEAMGVARVQDPKGAWIWVVVFGNKVDCPADPPGLAKLTADRSAADTSTTHRASGASIARSAARPTTAAAPSIDVSALLISNLRPTTGAPVTITNLSTRADTTNAAGTLDFGDGRPTQPIEMAAAQSVTTSWFAAGSPTLGFSANALPSLAVPLTTTGATLTPALAYTGPASGAQGASVTVTAHVTISGGSQPMVGRPVTFTLGLGVATAVTASNGVATATLVVPPATGVGPQTLHVAVDPIGASPGATLDVAWNVTGNLPPTANAGDPYTPLVNADLQLDAGASTDPDGPNPQIVWDLGGHGTFNDAAGTTATVTWADAQTKLCGGTCVPDQSYPIAARATDNHGAVSIAHSTVTYRRDFIITIDPANQILNPNASTNYQISLITTSGWATPIHLSVQGVPAGVTASFSDPSPTPNSTSILTLTAGSSIAPGTGPITVTGTSGSVTHTASSSVDLEFGLIPVCYGAASGTITDALSGLPLSGAAVFWTSFGSVRTTTDAQGHFTITDIPVGGGNTAANWPVNVADGNDYYVTQLIEPSACGITTQIDTTLTPRHYGSLSGSIVEGIPDPANHGSGRTVTPTSTPITTAQLQVADQGTGGAATTALNPDGTFSATGLFLGDRNAPEPYSGTAITPGYWQAYSTVSVSDGVPAVMTLAAVKECSASMTLRILDDTTHRPVPGATVSFYDNDDGNQAQYLTGTADGNGIINFPSVRLGYNNSTTTYSLRAGPPPGVTISGLPATAVTLTDCGAAAVAIVPIHLPVNHYASIHGHVTDAATNQPIANATVELSSLRQTVRTQADGSYALDNLLIGQDSQTTFNEVADSFADGYYSSPPTPITLTADQTLTQDFALVAQKQGVVQGTVTDIATGQPLANMTVVSYGGQTTTDAQGHYRISSNALLGPNNTPQDVQVQVYATPDYLAQTKTVNVTADAPVTVDFQLIHQCSPATIIGRVFNAATHAPLEGASVTTYGVPTATTDAAGNFTLPGIQLQNNNPGQIRVSASKQGFISASKDVTVFCGATITLDFGRDSSVTGTITGHVTDKRDNSAVGGAFVGSTFGGSATTDAQGAYTLTNVPLGDNGVPATWSVTVAPPAGSPLQGQTKSTTVASSPASVVDFALDATQLPPAPIATDDSGSTSYQTELIVDTAHGVLANDTGTGLTVSAHTDPAHGTVVVATDGSFTYTPASGFSGADSFTYTAQDTHSRTATATVRITVGAAPTLYALGDRVWQDTNGDGLQTAGEPGVAGVTVQLLDSNQQVLGSTTTDSVGHYVFDGLAAGTYRVRVIAPAGDLFTAKGANAQGTASAVDINGLSDAYPLTIGGDPNLTAVVPGDGVSLATQIDRTVDAGLIAAPKGLQLVLGVRPTGSNAAFATSATAPIGTGFDWQVTVTNTGTLPATGVAVTDPAVPACAQTIGDLGAGQTVTVPCAGVPTPTGDLTTFAHAAGQTDGGPLSADAGATVLLTYSIGDRVWLDLNHNGIQDPGEPGVAGVHINLLGGSGASTITDAQGAYRIDGLRPGSYSVQFLRPAGDAWTLTHVAGAAPGTDSAARWDVVDGQAASAEFVILDGQLPPGGGAPQAVTVPTLDAGLWVPALVGGTIFSDVNHNGTRGAGEPGVAGTLVRLLTASGAVAGQATSAADGTYRIGGLNAGDYRLELTPPAGFTLPGTKAAVIVHITAGQQLLTEDEALWPVQVPPTTTTTTTTTTTSTTAPASTTSLLPTTSLPGTTGGTPTTPLPRTGANIALLVAQALALLLAGTALVLAARRRRRA